MNSGDAVEPTRTTPIIASALWRRIDTPGHDACRLEERPAGWRLAGAAVFLHRGEPANLSYVVNCDHAWRALDGRVVGAAGEQAVDYLIQRRGDRGWALNGEDVKGLDHLDDLDLSFTPATNLLQIKRIALPLGEPVRSPAAWFDFDSGALGELEQVYERRSERALYYRAPGVGYEGLLELAPSGFIRLYPGLWKAEETH
jgi:hypothetical protein